MFAIAVLAAACGASPGPAVATVPPATATSVAASTADSSGSTTPSASATPSPLAFAACMRGHGVPNWPDPESNGQFDKNKIGTQQLGVSDSQLQTAQTACAYLLPNVTTSGAPPTPDVGQALQFSQCMRAHGVANFPDPAGGGRIPDPATLGIDQGSPVFQTANDACAASRPPYMPSNAEYNAWASSQP
jgi:hypothetical protein